MTFIQPNKSQNFWNKMLVLLGVLTVAATFGMVALYNMTVNLNHNIQSAKAQLDAIGAQSTDLNNKVMTALSGGDPSMIAVRDGLVADARPQYFSDP